MEYRAQLMKIGKMCVNIKDTAAEMFGGMKIVLDSDNRVQMKKSADYEIQGVDSAEGDMQMECNLAFFDRFRDTNVARTAMESLNEMLAKPLVAMNGGSVLMYFDFAPDSCSQSHYQLWPQVCPPPVSMV